VTGSADHALARREVTDDAGVPGTTWKKKSRQGSPEEANVGDEFSVSRFAGGGFVGADAAGIAAAARRNSPGEPTRLEDAARRHAAIGSRLGFNHEIFPFNSSIRQWARGEY
jgi:hypothetical protein